jgi:hypothetical protein
MASMAANLAEQTAISPVVDAGSRPRWPGGELLFWLAHAAFWAGSYGATLLVIRAFGPAVTSPPGLAATEAGL